TNAAIEASLWAVASRMVHRIDRAARRFVTRGGPAKLGHAPANVLQVIAAWRRTRGDGRGSWPRSSWVSAWPRLPARRAEGRSPAAAAAELADHRAGHHPGLAGPDDEPAGDAGDDQPQHRQRQPGADGAEPQHHLAERRNDDRAVRTAEP